VEKIKSKKQICSEVSVNTKTVCGIRGVSPEDEKVCCGVKRKATERDQ